MLIGYDTHTLTHTPNAIRLQSTKCLRPEQKSQSKAKPVFFFLYEIAHSFPQWIANKMSLSKIQQQNSNSSSNNKRNNNTNLSEIKICKGANHVSVDIKIPAMEQNALIYKLCVCHEWSRSRMHTHHTNSSSSWSSAYLKSRNMPMFQFVFTHI